MTESELGRFGLEVELLNRAVECFNLEMELLNFEVEQLSWLAARLRDKGSVCSQVDRVESLAVASHPSQLRDDDKIMAAKPQFTTR